ncbi:MAG: phytanoyl-CoA dioxygenase family protein [Candidatus Eremiobacteraeota bacterium]|nr:phytanoyl-CoA dioxygenase family protein [Candidatus Eremiobacteraeota bacterium]MBC5826160.1 phytanoyl-CoA dioxygenase family protein [Candidatus Eremiobacteraeota bacterium]
MDQVAYRTSIVDNGYAIVPSVLSTEEVRAMRSALESLLGEARLDPSWRAGGTLHLGDLSPVGVFEPAWTSPKIRAVVEQLLGPQARVARAHFRAPQPGFGAQTLHADCPEPIMPGDERIATAIVALVDFNEVNGATRLVPGSHKVPRLALPANPEDRFPGQIAVRCAAGDAIVFSGHLRHSGTRNRSRERRDSLQISFLR